MKIIQGYEQEALTKSQGRATSPDKQNKQTTKLTLRVVESDARRIKG